MKIRGGYLPRPAGRPAREVQSVPVPDTLSIELRQFGEIFSAAVGDGDTVAFGAPLAWAAVPGGRVALPAPAAGTVALEKPRKGNPGKCVLTVTDARPRPTAAPAAPERITAEAMRKALADGGVWPLLWSSRAGGPPPLDSAPPHRMMVNCVIAEPFRARGKTVLLNDRERFTAGLRYLPRLLAEYGVVHLVMTELKDPVAQAVRQETAGQAWIRIESVPLLYPVGDPRVLCAALRRGNLKARQEEDIWVLDAQAVCAVGACMGEGIPLHERILALGGPGAVAPRHLRVRAGTALDAFIEPVEPGHDRLVLRGGMLKGRPTDASAAVASDDDAFFVLPRSTRREFLGFVNPGFDRVSIQPCFASRLTGAKDRHITASLRGERRPCIACGLCEEVCPVDLLPQVLHRYLYRDAIDEAGQAGLMRCIGCGLCSYVCPSKIELRHQFAEAMERLALERAEAAAAEAAHARQESSLQNEKEHTGDWLK